MAQLWTRIKGGYFFRVFLLKITCCACLAGSGLKFIFYWKAQLVILARSPCKSFVDEFLFLITENNEASLANNCAFGTGSSGKSLI